MNSATRNDSDAALEEALKLLEMCTGCDLYYEAWAALGTDHNTDKSTVMDHVEAFLKKHRRSHDRS